MMTDSEGYFEITEHTSIHLMLELLNKIDLRFAVHVIDFIEQSKATLKATEIPENRFALGKPEGEVNERIVIAALSEYVASLCKVVHEFNCVLTITQEPDQPLAMGNYTTVIEVRPARKPAEIKAAP